MQAAASIQFDFTTDDYLHLARRVTYGGEQARAWRKFRVRMVWQTVGATLFTGLYISALATNYKGMVDPGNVMIAVFGSLVAFIWWDTVGLIRKGSRGNVEQQLRQYADTPDVRRSLGPTSVTLYPAALVWDSQLLSVVQPWGQLISVEETPELILFFRDESGAYAAPKRAFESPARATEFLDLARGFYAQAPRDPAVDVRRLLAENDVPCPGCGYNLRGMTSQSCPECGAAFTLPQLVRAAHDRAGPRSFRLS